MNFAENILHFHSNLILPTGLPAGVEVLNPYQEHETRALAEQFYNKYYADHTQRHIILGINPGRFGGGVTGVPFTDPIKLEAFCGIQNDLPKKPELSAEFIWKVIHEFGGPEEFFSRFYINSVFPLGFTKDGKNLNYYDIPALLKIASPYSAVSIRTQLEFGIDRDLAFCLGEGTNFKCLSKINQQHGFFKEIVPLPHPRFIMQYRRKFIPEFVELFISRLAKALL